MGNPVFLLASERSGTNLLRRRLSELQSTIVGPPPIHFLKHLYYAAPYYGDLRDDKVFKGFVADALGLAYNHFSPWEEIITAEEVLEKYSTYFPGGRSAIGVMHLLYTIYAERKGFASYFCKDNNLFDFACQISVELPSSKFVYLYRDPRDVVVSQIGRPMQNKNIYYLSRLWRDEQIKCISEMRALSEKNRVVSLSYENLISDENGQIDILCRFLGLTKGGSPGIDFSFEKTDFVEWENIGKPTLSNNKGKYKTALGRRAISKIESIVWRQMCWLGYAPENSNRPKSSKINEELWIRAGGVARFVRAKLLGGKQTDGQIARSEYARMLAKRWK